MTVAHEIYLGRKKKKNGPATAEEYEQFTHPAPLGDKQ